MEEVDVDSLLESLEIKRDKSVSIPTCISSVMSAKPKILFLLVLLKSNTKLYATVWGRLLRSNLSLAYIVCFCKWSNLCIWWESVWPIRYR